MKKLLLGVLVSALLASNVVFAESNSTYAFVDGGSLSSGDFCDVSATGLTLSSCSKSSTAYRVGFGYTGNNGGLGMELSYANLGEFSGDASMLVSGVGTVGFKMKVSGTALLLPATYSFKLNDRTLLALKLGVAFTQGKGDASFTSGAGTLNGTSFYNKSSGGTAAIYGIGISEKISDAISVRLQYEIINKLKVDDSSTGGIGINNLGLFSFGLAAGF